jgi:MFS family permease
MAWFREGERGLAMSIRQTAVPAGGGLGALLLPALATKFGFVSVYALLALSCAITAGLAWRWLHEPTHVENGDVRAAYVCGGHGANGAGAVGRVGGASGANGANGVNGVCGVSGVSGVSGANGTSGASSVSGASGMSSANDINGARARSRSPLRDARIWRVALGAGALCVPQLAVITFGTVFLHDFGRAAVLTISVAMAAVQAGAAIARIWSGRWTDQRGNRRAYMRGCSLLTAVLFAALTLMSGVAGMQHTPTTMMTMFLVPMIVLGGVCASAWHGVAFTELATLAGTSRAGTALALGNTCVFLSLFLTPLAIPSLLSLGSWPMVWAVASFCALIAVPVFPRALREVTTRAPRACDTA